MNPFLAHLVSRAYDGSLAPAHFDDLRKSALGGEIIREQHIRSVPPSLIGQLIKAEGLPF